MSLRDLPYTVSHQQALQYDQVRKKLDDAIKLLQSTVRELLTRITESRNLIPYGMLYMAKVLNETLTAKFPNAPEKDMLKVVGNLIYYHFINAAIVAPDAFDIITLPVDRSLSNDQRRNLASIAKILQFAASKKGVSISKYTRMKGFAIFIVHTNLWSQSVTVLKPIFLVWWGSQASSLLKSIYNRMPWEI